MFKLTGAVLIMLSTVFISSQKILELWFTYRFLQQTADIIQKLIYEKDLNTVYGKIFDKWNFDYTCFINLAKSNGYIKRSEINYVNSFFYGLGRHNSAAEEKYLYDSLIAVIQRKDEYYLNYRKNKKLHILCGAAAGMLIIIFLI